MTLLEKLQSIKPEDHDRDAAEFFGPDVQISDGMLIAGGQAVAFDKALAAVYGPPSRTVEIGDLQS